MAKGTLKCCAIVRNMVVQADFYEEEDFVPQTFGFGMCELTPEPEILAELLRVEQRLTARIKWLKMSEEEREAAAESAEAARLARLEKIRAAAEEAAAEAGGEDLPRRRADDLEDPGDGSTEALLCAEGEDEIALAEALRARVTYRRGYLNGLFQLHSKGAKAATFAHKSFKFAQTQLAALAKHVGLGTAAQSKSEDPSIGFNADCNRRLLGPAPPRAMEEMSIEQGIAAAESLFGDMCGKTTLIFRLACFRRPGLKMTAWLAPRLRMLEVVNQPTMTSMVYFFVRFSDSLPNVVPSSILMVIFYSNSHGTVLGRGTLASILLQDADDHGVPAKLELAASAAAGDSAKSEDETAPFWELFERTMLYAFRILSKNQSRQHRKLGRILQSWSQLQEEAHYLDTQVSLKVEERHTAATKAATEAGEKPPPPLQTLPPPPQVYTWYTLQWTAYFMIRHLLIGFELELYPPAEWRLIFWYVDHLITHRLHALKLLTKAKEEQLRQAKALREAAAPAPAPSRPKSGKKGKKGKGGKKAKGAGGNAAGAGAEELLPPTSALRVEQLLMDAQRALCAASFRMLSGLWLTRQLTLPTPLFVEKVMPLDAQQRLKFEHRFAPFQLLIQPKPLEYEQYVNDSTIPQDCEPNPIFKQVRASPVSRCRF